ncbi:hypothetical protein Pcinc_039616 [Petrolisthes cinctipes]|uniref:Uncharacterized protein n=1 Tax=Petrolisthes cinctipes TaxID=88211 RepID=A0AAE1BNW6_PETCI|nr:hypothetical protein Pcinc_039616 [Petrolisthes cinctipes]
MREYREREGHWITLKDPLTTTSVGSRVFSGPCLASVGLYKSGCVVLCCCCCCCSVLCKKERRVNIINNNVWSYKQRQEDDTSGRKVVFSDLTCSAIIQVEGGKIKHISRHTTDVSSFPQHQVVDCGDLVLMAGVGTHTYTSTSLDATAWEGYNSATRAAIAGGITTIVDMPLNSIPPTTTLEAWQTKMEAAQGQCWADVGFWAVVVPGNTSELLKMTDRGICGFKCFLIHSGVDEFPCGTNSVLLFHAECDIGETVTASDPSENTVRSSSRDHRRWKRQPSNKSLVCVRRLR